jgi:hypothetical protein
MFLPIPLAIDVGFDQGMRSAPREGAWLSPFKAGDDWKLATAMVSPILKRF